MVSDDCFPFQIKYSVIIDVFMQSCLTCSLCSMSIIFTIDILGCDQIKIAIKCI